jgi:hypothetical protein
MIDYLKKDKKIYIINSMNETIITSRFTNNNDITKEEGV